MQPYFPAPKGEAPAQYTMRKIAPRKVWPIIAFGASIGCWYEHISRTACLLLSKNHRLLEFLTKLLTRNRYAFFYFPFFPNYLYIIIIIIISIPMLHRKPSPVLISVSNHVLNFLFHYLCNLFCIAKNYNCKHHII